MKCKDGKAISKNYYLEGAKGLTDDKDIDNSVERWETNGRYAHKMRGRSLC